MSGTLRRFYTILLTAPHLCSPISIITLTYFPSSEVVEKLTREQLDRHRKNFSLPIHAHEKPQVHVVPIDIADSQLR